MSKIFDVDYRKGSFIELMTGAVGTPTGQSTAPVFSKQEKGLGLIDSDGFGYTCNYDFNAEVHPVSYEVWIRHKKSASSYTGYISTKDAAQDGMNLACHNSNDVLAVLIGDGAFEYFYSSGQNLVEGKLYQIVATVNEDMEVKFYINGVFDSEDVTAATVTDIVYSGLENVHVGAFYDLPGNLSFNGPLFRAMIYDHVLTAKEVAKSYEEFLRSFPISTKVNGNLRYPKPTDLSHLVDSRIGVPEADPAEICSNGTFDSDTTGWVASNNAVISSEGGQLKVENGLATRGRAGYTQTPVAGRKYLISAQQGAAGSHYARVVWSGVALHTFTAVGEVYYDVVTATSSAEGEYFRIDCGGTALGNTSYADNISIKEWNGEEVGPNRASVLQLQTDSWGVTANCSIDSETVFSTSDGTGVLYFTNFWPIALTGKKYRLVVSFVAENSSTLTIRSSGLNITFDGSTAMLLSAGTHHIDVVVNDADNIVFDPNGGIADTFTFSVFSIMEITGLVAAYNMIPNGSTLVDISGEGNNGTVVAGQSSPIKDGMQFKGETDPITMSSFTVYGDLTIAFRGNTTYSENQVIIAHNTGNRAQFNSLTKTCTFRADSGDTITLSGGNWVSGEDFDIVITRSGIVIKMYQDGVLIDTQTETSAGGLLLSKIGGRNIQWWVGAFKDLRVFNYAFNEQQAQDYHNQFARRVGSKEKFEYGVGSTT